MSPPPGFFITPTQAPGGPTLRTYAQTLATALGTLCEGSLVLAASHAHVRQTWTGPFLRWQPGTSCRARSRPANVGASQLAQAARY